MLIGHSRKPCLLLNQHPQSRRRWKPASYYSRGHSRINGSSSIKLARNPSRFLPFERGIPSHDTLNDVVNAIDPELFKACFLEWVETLRDTDKEVIAIDGKTSRRTHARAKGREPLHLVSAWATRQRLVLGQEAVADKSNEITAIPRLLERLELTGALVTIDAIGTQVDIAKTIVKRGGDYLLALKGNRPATHSDVAAFFADRLGHSSNPHMLKLAKAKGGPPLAPRS